jgi:hypothetical protein
MAGEINMLRSNFNFKDNMEDVDNLVLEKTISQIKELQEKFNKEVFDKLCEDIEDWLFERFDNVRWQYFNGIVAYLLDQNCVYITNKETLEQWLSKIGYTQQSFRKKIYEDNKETVNKAIVYDAVYEALKNLFNHSYFKSWTFKDITINYPQTIIIKEFMRQLILTEGFNDEIKNMLDVEIKNKMNELSNLKLRIGDIQDKLGELV